MGGVHAEEGFLFVLDYCCLFVVSVRVAFYHLAREVGCLGVPVVVGRREAAGYNVACLMSGKSVMGTIRVMSPGHRRCAGPGPWWIFQNKSMYRRFTFLFSSAQARCLENKKLTYRKILVPQNSAPAR